jgi:hypothetical protein
MNSDDEIEAADELLEDCMCDFPETCQDDAGMSCTGCGGDHCICTCGGYIECWGCPDCPDPDGYDFDGNPDPASAPERTEGLGSLRSYLRACLPSPRGTEGTHFTWLKAIVNTPLRFLQLWCTDRPWLLASVNKPGTGGADWEWSGRYTFARTTMRWRNGR